MNLIVSPKILPHGRDRRAELGFSTIEAVAVCVIIGILAASSVPQIFQSLQAYRLDSTAGTLADGALAARLTAIKYNKPASVKIDASNSRIEIWTTDAASQPVRVKIVGAVPPQISVIDGSPLQVTFNSLGRNQANTSSTIQFQIIGTSFCKSVTMSAAGNITSEVC